MSVKPSQWVAMAGRMNALRSRREVMCADPSVPVTVRSTLDYTVDTLQAIVDAFGTADGALAASADDVAAKVAAFDRIAVLVGASGVDDRAPAADLLREVGLICAAVHGVPNPVAADTSDAYRVRAAEPGMLTRRQRAMLGIPRDGEAS